MRADRLTLMAQEAMQAAHDLAASRSHPEVRPLHLLHALVTQRGGIVPPILEQLGVDPRVDASTADQKLGEIARVQGQPDVGFSRAIQQVVQDAEKAAR